MDIRPLQEKVKSFLKKYRYVALVFAIGLILMAIPLRSQKKEPVQTDPKTETSVTEVKSETGVEQKLEKILSRINGAGEVHVLLTAMSGEETVYQENADIQKQSDSSSSRTETVLITDTQHAQDGLIRQVNPPQYRGAIVVCRGADDPSVKLAIVDAVSKVTDLPTNCISVLKSK